MALEWCGTLKPGRNATLNSQNDARLSALSPGPVIVPSARLRRKHLVVISISFHTQWATHRLHKGYTSLCSLHQSVLVTDGHNRLLIPGTCGTLLAYSICPNQIQPVGFACKHKARFRCFSRRVLCTLYHVRMWKQVCAWISKVSCWAFHPRRWQPMRTFWTYVSNKLFSRKWEVHLSLTSLPLSLFLPALGCMNKSVDIMQNTSNSKHIIYPRLLPFLSGRCMSCPFRFFSLFTFEP